MQYLPVSVPANAMSVDGDPLSLSDHPCPSSMPPSSLAVLIESPGVAEQDDGSGSANNQSISGIHLNLSQPHRSLTLTRLSGRRAPVLALKGLAIVHKLRSATDDHALRRL